MIHNNNKKKQNDFIQTDNVVYTYFLDSWQILASDFYLHVCIWRVFTIREEKRLACLLGNQIIDGPAFLQSLFHLNQQLYAIDYTLNLLHFWKPQPIGVRDVVHASHGRRVNASRATLLQTEFLQDVV